MANYDGAIFVGHGTSEVDGSYDPGATSGGKQEHIIAEKITDKAVDLCRARGLNIHRDEQNYKDNDLAGNTYNYKYAQSIHLNAGGGTRAEIYAPCKDSYLDAEFYMLKELEKIGLKNGGVKSRDYNTEKVFMRTNGVALPYSDYYGEIARAYAQGVSLDIIEVGFIDSSDVNIIENNIDRIATIIANGMLMVCGKPLYKIGTENNSNTNNNQGVNFDMKYIVQYENDVDRRAAEYLADSLKCPTIDSKRPFDYSKIENVIAVGGGSNFSSYTKYHIKGADRYETATKTIEVAKDHRKLENYKK